MPSVSTVILKLHTSHAWCLVWNIVIDWYRVWLYYYLYYLPSTRIKIYLKRWDRFFGNDWNQQIKWSVYFVSSKQFPTVFNWYNYFFLFLFCFLFFHTIFPVTVKLDLVSLKASFSLQSFLKIMSVLIHQIGGICSSPDRSFQCGRLDIWNVGGRDSCSCC